MTKHTETEVLCMISTWPAHSSYYRSHKCTQTFLTFFLMEWLFCNQASLSVPKRDLLFPSTRRNHFTVTVVTMEGRDRGILLSTQKLILLKNFQQPSLPANRKINHPNQPPFTSITCVSLGHEWKQNSAELSLYTHHSPPLLSLQLPVVS